MIFLLRYKKFIISYKEDHTITGRSRQYSISNVRINNRIQSTIHKWYNGQIEYNYGQSSADGRYEIIAALSHGLFMGKWSMYIGVSYYYKKILITDYKTYGEDTTRIFYYGAARNLVYKTDSNISKPQNQSPSERLRKWHIVRRSLISVLDKYMEKLAIN